MTGKASRQLEALPEQVRRRADSVINSLEQNPRPPRIEKLSGTIDEWRIRVGNYRILLEIDDSSKTVLVYRIMHRREVYR